MTPLIGVGGVALVVGGIAWSRVLARWGWGPVLLAAYGFSVPWGDVIELPLPSVLASPSSLLGLVTITVLAVGLVTGRATAFPATAIGPALGFLGVALATSLWSRSAGTTLESVLVLAATMAVFLAVAGHRFDWLDIRRFEVAVVSGAGLICSYAILQAQIGGLSVGRSGVPRFETVGGDANATAASLVLPFAIAFAHAVDEEFDRMARVRWAAGAGVILAGVFLTVSRGGLLAVGLVIVVVLVDLVRWDYLVSFTVVVAVVGMSVLSLASAEVAGHLSDTGSTGRTQIWRLGVDACEDECVAGSGFGTFPLVYTEQFNSNPTAGGYQSSDFKAHNVFLQMAVETGVVGALLFVATMASILVAAIRVPFLARSGPVAAAVGLLATNSLITNADFKYFWLVPAYVAMCRSAGREYGDRALLQRVPATLPGATEVTP